MDDLLLVLMVSMSPRIESQTHVRNGWQKIGYGFVDEQSFDCYLPKIVHVNYIRTVKKTP